MLRCNNLLPPGRDLVTAQQMGAALDDAAQNVLMPLLRLTPALAQWPEMDVFHTRLTWG